MTIKSFIMLLHLPQLHPVFPVFPSSLCSARLLNIHLYREKLPRMYNKSSSTENILIQLWIDLSNECLGSFCVHFNPPSPCHEPIVQLSASQTKQKRRAAWIIRCLMPHEIYIKLLCLPSDLQSFGAHHPTWFIRAVCVCERRWKHLLMLQLKWTRCHGWDTLRCCALRSFLGSVFGNGM